MDTVTVHELIFDNSLNPRQHGVDADVVELYASFYRDVVWPPVLAHRGSYRLLDGWHRVEAAKRAGVYTVPVQWVDADDEQLFALAVKANMGHGLRLTREESFKSIHRLMREGWTPERLAEFFGCALGMIERVEKAEDLRIRFRVQDNAAANLTTESLVEVIRLPEELQEEVAEMAAQVEANTGDVRRAVRAIKKGLAESPEEIRRTMTDPEYAKARQAGMPGVDSTNWLYTFGTLVDQLERTPLNLGFTEREAAKTLLARLREWSDTQLARITAGENPGLPGV